MLTFWPLISSSWPSAVVACVPVSNLDDCAPAARLRQARNRMVIIFLIVV